MLDDLELITVDLALRALYPDGLKQLLGRSVLASDRIAEQKRAALKKIVPSRRVRRLFERRQASPDGSTRRPDEKGKRSA